MRAGLCEEKGHENIQRGENEHDMSIKRETVVFCVINQWFALNILACTLFFYCRCKLKSGSITPANCL